MDTNSLLIGVGIGVAVGVIIGFLIDRLLKGGSYRTADGILVDARKAAANLEKEAELSAKENLLKQREKLEKELEGVRNTLHNKERGIDKREVLVDERQEDLRKKEGMLESQQKRLSDRLKITDTQEQELNRLIKQEQNELFKISGLSQDDAKKQLLEKIGQDLRNETGGLILKHEAEIKEKKDVIAREIIGMAVQRYASAHTSETTVSTVDIPSDDMKGRIIGREGRNIRAFEKYTGVDVIVDDTPGVVIVSAFDTVRREVGKIALQKLIQDGRIHPTRIEEIVGETQKEMGEQILRFGKEGVLEADIAAPHEKLVHFMGRLNFRMSYSQNVLRHSIEVAHLTGMMAEQLGLDGTLARRCGFFHDIGKAADHELEGGHPAIGADLLKRYGEGVEVVHAAAGHHDDIRPEYIYTVLVAAADAISAARPGARRETLEKYVRRLEELEAIANGFPGVQQTYAMQAGRDVRVIVNPKTVNDQEAAAMARDIAKTIEDNLTYPGEVRVTVMRETRAIGTAR